MNIIRYIVWNIPFFYFIKFFQFNVFNKILDGYIVLKHVYNGSICKIFLYIRYLKQILDKMMRNTTTHNMSSVKEGLAVFWRKERFMRLPRIRQSCIWRSYLFYTNFLNVSRYYIKKKNKDFNRKCDAYFIVWTKQIDWMFKTRILLLIEIRMAAEWYKDLNICITIIILCLICLSVTTNLITEQVMNLLFQLFNVI